MQEYILLVRLPITYGPEQAGAVRAQWTALTDQWKADGIFVTSFIAPAEGYVVSGATAEKGQVVSNELRIVSNIILRAPNLEAALALAKKCPILEQGGTVEVRECQPRPVADTSGQEEITNKKIVKNLYEHILNNRKFELLNDIISPEYTGIGNSQEKGAKNFLNTVQFLIDGFPDIKWNIHDVLADGDKVILRWTWTATNTRPFRGIPATNRSVTDSAIAIYQLRDGKITNAWLQTDRFGIFTQMGLIPQELTSPKKF